MENLHEEVSYESLVRKYADEIIDLIVQELDEYPSDQWFHLMKNGDLITEKAGDDLICFDMCLWLDEDTEEKKAKAYLAYVENGLVVKTECNVWEDVSDLVKKAEKIQEQRAEIVKALNTYCCEDLHRRTGVRKNLFGAFLKNGFYCPKKYLESLGYKNVKLEKIRHCDRASVDGFFLSSNGFCSRVTDIIEVK
jgi:hypothetical protein